MLPINCVFVLEEEEEEEEEEKGDILAYLAQNNTNPRQFINITSSQIARKPRGQRCHPNKNY